MLVPVVNGFAGIDGLATVGDDDRGLLILDRADCLHLDDRLNWLELGFSDFQQNFAGLPHPRLQVGEG